jgi:predicted NBD/HSP70 family sugar kinase
MTSPRPHQQGGGAVAPSLLRTLNQKALLTHLYAEGAALTRPQLARACGLSQPTVSAALEDLLGAGLVVTSNASAAIGRPALGFATNAQAGSVLAVDIGREWIRMLLIDINGNNLARHAVRNSASDADALVGLVVAEKGHILRQARLTTDRLTYTVIASPGVLDESRGRLRYAANLPGWHRPGLTAALVEHLGAALAVDNDVNLAAIAEHRLGAGRGLDNFVYLHIGTGIGVGIIANGALYRGATGAAGEVGYIPTHTSTPRTRRSSRGATEELLAADAVVRYAKEAGRGRYKNAQEVFDAVRDGNAVARSALVTYAEHLAHLIGGLSAVLDPGAIVFGGGVGQNLDLFLEDTLTALRHITPMHPQLVTTELGAESIVQGAAVRGLELARARVFELVGGEEAAS